VAQVNCASQIAGDLAKGISDAGGEAVHHGDRSQRDQGCHKSIFDQVLTAFRPAEGLSKWRCSSSHFPQQILGFASVEAVVIQVCDVTYRFLSLKSGPRQLVGHGFSRAVNATTHSGFSPGSLFAGAEALTFTRLFRHD
jgi:hypothetical protein